MLVTFLERTVDLGLLWRNGSLLLIYEKFQLQRRYEIWILSNDIVAVVVVVADSILLHNRLPQRSFNELATYMYVIKCKALHIALATKTRGIWNSMSNDIGCYILLEKCGWFIHGSGEKPRIEWLSCIDDDELKPGFNEGVVRNATLIKTIHVAFALSKSTNPERSKIEIHKLKSRFHFDFQTPSVT